MNALPMITNRFSRTMFLFLPVLAGLLIGLPDAKGYYDERRLHTDAYTVEALERIVADYRTQVNVLHSQIRDNQRDLDWLNLKINRIFVTGRKVPRALVQSVPKKEEKITGLVKQKRGLEAIVAEYERALDEKLKQMASESFDSESSGSESSGSESSDGQIKSQAINDPDPSMVQGKIFDLEQAVKKAGLQDWVAVLDAAGGCARINNTLPILFSSGSAELAGAYKAFLGKLAQFLKPYDVKIYVNGFADTDPIHTQKYPSNFELGATRAANIVHEMVRYGLKPDIFKIGTTGEYRFAAKTPTRQKSFQRRAQVTVVFSG